MAYLIRTKCKPTQFQLIPFTLDNNRTQKIVQLRNVSANSGNFDEVSMAKANNTPIDYNGRQEMVVIKNWLLKKGGIKNSFKKPRYKWLYDSIISDIKLYRNDNIQGKLEYLRNTLNEIDTQINRSCFEQKITTLTGALRDRTIQEEMEKKYNIVTKQFDSIIDSMKKSANKFQIKITDNGLRYYDIAEQIFDYEVIIAQLMKLKQLTLQDFKQTHRNKPTRQTP